jgi:hypothetical protein
MKSLLLAAGISALTLPGALACEYGHQAANTDRATAVACSGDNCEANQPTAANAPTNDAGRVELAQDTCTGPNCERIESTLISLRPAELAKPNGK